MTTGIIEIEDLLPAETEDNAVSDPMLTAHKDGEEITVEALLRDYLTLPRRGSTTHADAAKLQEQTEQMCERGVFTSREGAADDLVKSLHAYFAETTPPRTRIGTFWRSLIAAALASADWHDIAMEMLIEYRLPAERGDEPAPVRRKKRKQREVAVEAVADDAPIMVDAPSE